MKTKISTLILTLITAVALAHEGVDLGPNGGRLLDLGKSGTTKAEITAKDGNFHVAILDKNKKPVALDKQVLTATTADRDNPKKLEVTKDGNHFVVPMQKGDDHWTILQFKSAPDAKQAIARLHYDAAICDACKKAEWVCACKKH